MNRVYLCKGDYDNGGQYCISFGAALDRCMGQELLKRSRDWGWRPVRALEELGAGGTLNVPPCPASSSNWCMRRGRPSNSTTRWMPGIDLQPASLERRWNGKLEEIEAVKQRLSSLETEHYSLSPQGGNQNSFDGRSLCWSLAEQPLSPGA